MARMRNLKILQRKIDVETRQIWELGLDDQNQYWMIVYSPVRLQEGRQAFVEAFKEANNLNPSTSDGNCPKCGSRSMQVRHNVTDLGADTAGRRYVCNDEWHGNWP
jgi:hypothetical protein